MLLGDEIGLRGDGSEHRASAGGRHGRVGGLRRPAALAVRVSYPRCSTRRGATARAVAVRRGVPLPDLPRPRPRLRRRLPARAAFAAAPILLIALRRASLRRDRASSSAFCLQPWVLPSVFVVNIVALLYRLVAIIDAYRVTDYLNAVAASGGGRLGGARRSQPARFRRRPARRDPRHGRRHVVVARYDLIALDALERRASSSARARPGHAAGRLPDARGRSDRPPDETEAARGRPADDRPGRPSAPCRTSRSRRGTARSA